MSGLPATRIEEFDDVSSSPQDVVESVVNAALETRGRNIEVLKVSRLFPEADYFVVISGASDRRVQGITNRILFELKQRGLQPHSLEGLENGQWVLIDCGEVVVHVFYEPMREHYDLEGLWSQAPHYQVVDNPADTTVALQHGSE